MPRTLNGYLKWGSMMAIPLFGFLLGIGYAVYCSAPYACDKVSWCTVNSAGIVYINRVQTQCNGVPDTYYYCETTSWEVCPVRSLCSNRGNQIGEGVGLGLMTLSMFMIIASIITMCICTFGPQCGLLPKDYTEIKDAPEAQL